MSRAVVEQRDKRVRKGWDEGMIPHRILIVMFLIYFSLIGYILTSNSIQEFTSDIVRIMT